MSSVSEIGEEILGGQGYAILPDLMSPIEVSRGRKPSLRYIGLLIEGAAQHGLPPDYLDFLESFDLATDERPQQQRLPR